MTDSQEHEKQGSASKSGCGRLIAIGLVVALVAVLIFAYLLQVKIVAGVARFGNMSQRKWADEKLCQYGDVGVFEHCKLLFESSDYDGYRARRSEINLYRLKNKVFRNPKHMKIYLDALERFGTAKISGYFLDDIFYCLRARDVSAELKSQAYFQVAVLVGQNKVSQWAPYSDDEVEEIRAATLGSPAIYKDFLFSPILENDPCANEEICRILASKLPQIWRRDFNLNASISESAKSKQRMADYYSFLQPEPITGLLAPFDQKTDPECAALLNRKRTQTALRNLFQRKDYDFTHYTVQVVPYVYANLLFSDLATPEQMITYFQETKETSVLFRNLYLTHYFYDQFAVRVKERRFLAKQQSKPAVLAQLKQIEERVQAKHKAISDCLRAQILKQVKAQPAAFSEFGRSFGYLPYADMETVLSTLIENKVKFDSQRFMIFDLESLRLALAFREQKPAQTKEHLSFWIDQFAKGGLSLDLSSYRLVVSRFLLSEAHRIPPPEVRTMRMPKKFRPFLRFYNDYYVWTNRDNKEIRAQLKGDYSKFKATKSDIENVLDKMYYGFSIETTNRICGFLDHWLTQNPTEEAWVNQRKLTVIDHTLTTVQRSRMHFRSDGTRGLKAGVTIPFTDLARTAEILEACSIKPEKSLSLTRELLYLATNARIDWDAWGLPNPVTAFVLKQPLDPDKRRELVAKNMTLDDKKLSINEQYYQPPVSFFGNKKQVQALTKLISQESKKP